MKKVYCVTIARYANIYCAANSADEAMKVAEKNLYSVDDDEFEGSDRVDGCEVDPTDIEDIDEDELIYGEEGPVDYQDFVEAYEEEEEDDKDWRNKVEWTSTEWLFPKEEVMVKG